MPLRILYKINNLHTAGMRFVVSDLVQRLERSIFTPLVAVNKKTGSSLEQEVGRHCEIIELPLRIPFNPLYTFFNKCLTSARKLRRIANCAHSFDYSSDWTEGLVFKLAGIPWIMEKTNFNWGTFNWKLRAFLATKIVCLSQVQQKKLFENTRYHKKTVLIPTGIDTKRFSPPSIDWKTMKRKEMGIFPNAFILSCVADLIPVKGHKELLKAFAYARKRHAGNAYLLQAGGGELNYENYLKILSHDLGISDFVLFLGRRDDVQDILKISDGFILPTRGGGRKEAFGTAIVEAMSCELPIIATQSGGPQDIVIDGKTGWLVEAEGVEPLIKPLMEMMNNNQKRVLFGKAGRDRVKKFFRVEKMVERYQKLYLGLVNE